MKKILLSSLLAVMAVTSANAKIASTEYADAVAASEAAAAEEAAETTAKNYTDGLTGDVVNSDYIKGLVDKTLTGAVEDLDSRVEGLTGTGDQAAATKKELEDGLATKLGKDENAVSATKATQDASGNVITSTYATKAEILNLDSAESGTGKFITGVAQADGKVTVTKGNIAYSDLTGTPTIDTELSTTSPNAVQNKAVTTALNGKLGKTEKAVSATTADSATMATQDASGNVITSTYATKAEISNLDSTESGTGNFITGVAQTDGKVTVTKGNIAYSDLTGTPTIDTALSTDSTNAVQNKAVTTALNGKQDNLSTEQLAAVNSGITAVKVTQYDGYASGKQNALTETQLNAVNSGITAAKVTQYDGYASGKQNTLTEAQLNAVDSGATKAKIDAIATNTTAIGTINSSDVMTSGATKAKIDAIATNTAAIALNTALRVAIENNANKVDGEGAEGTYALTAVVNEQGVSQFKWEKIGR